MECTEAKERLLEYREGQLDLEGRMQLQAHLLMCGECLEELEALDALFSAVAALPVPDPSPDFVHRIHSRIAKEKQRFWGELLRNIRLLLVLVVAGLAFVLVVGGIAWTHSSHPTSFPVIAGSAVLHEAVENSLLQKKEGKAMLNLWSDMETDWAALSEKSDPHLASLALRSEDLTVEEVVRLWETELPGRDVMEGLVEIRMKLSDAEFEELLLRMR